MRNERLSSGCLVAVTLSICFCVDFVFAAQPSFNCSKASRPDEVAICSNETLASVDNVANNGFEYLRSKLGRSTANAINLPLIKKRQSCGGNYQCILNAQMEAINTFISYGAPIAIPNLNGGYHQQSNGARDELGPTHEASPQAAQEVERPQQTEVEATGRSALKADNLKPEEVEAARHSAEQAERQRQAEAGSVQRDLKETTESVEKERTYQSDIQIALIIAGGLLVLGVAFILAKTMVKGRQRALGPSLVASPVDHNAHDEPSTSTQSAASSAEPTQSSINSRLEALEYEQAPPPNEGESSIAIWYYEKAGKSFGPVTEDFIKTLFKNDEINKYTFVWNSSLGGQWVSIQETELIS
jgi:uncharacterized protein